MSRQNRTGIAKSRGQIPARKPTNKLRQLWDAIRQTENELTRWTQQRELVDSLFRLHILPRESRLTNTLCKLSSRLMDCYEQGGLASPERALLTLWISDNLQILNTHPFAEESQRTSLSHRWRKIQSEETQLKASDKNAHGSVQGSLAEALHEDELNEHDVVFNFGWHESPRSNNQQTSSSSPSEESGRRGAEKNRSTDEQHSSDGEPDRPYTASQSARRDNTLGSRVSIDRLFRQLARTLHPDREQDETRKAEKHVLMSQCLEARQNKDINTLLTLYCEHVGELPNELSDDEHGDLIKMLKSQLSDLQTELRQTRSGTTLQVQIFERYNTPEPTQTQRLIQQHAHALDIEIKQLELDIKEINSHDKLLHLLSNRRTLELNRLAINEMTGYSLR